MVKIHKENNKALDVGYESKSNDEVHEPDE